MGQIVRNEDLLARIVRAVDKAVSDDLPQYKRENPTETSNHIPQKRADLINTNLRQLCVVEGTELHPFTRYSWQGRILIDHPNRTTYTVTTKSTLKSIPKKERNSPHFLQSLLGIENAGIEPRALQLSLFPGEAFSLDVLRDDYNSIMAGVIDLTTGYQHYVVAYALSGDGIKDIRMDFLDGYFNLIDTMPLNEFIQSDYARLTAPCSLENDSPKSETKTSRDLLSIKPGLPLKPHDDEEEA